MGFGMEIRQNPRNTRKTLTFNSLLAPKRMAQIEQRLFYPHTGFGSLGSACPAMAGRGEEQIPALPSLGLGLQEGWSLFQLHLGWFWSWGNAWDGTAGGVVADSRKKGDFTPYGVRSVRKSIQVRCVGSEAVHRPSPNQTSL